MLNEQAERFEAKRDPNPGPYPAGFFGQLERLVEAPRFGMMVIGMIVLNAIIIGLETYPSVAREIGHELHILDRCLLGFFTVELFLRLLSIKFNPKRFFTRGWNIFDFIVVGSSYIPGLGANSTALRLIRLLRVARLLSVVPDIKVLLDGIRRAMRPAMGLVLLTVLLLYLYGIIGWSLFHKADPERWGTAGESMLTLFTLLTLEGWNEILAHARDVSPFAVVFILSFILFGTFVVLNLVIGVVITSLDEAHAEHRKSQGHGDLNKAVQQIRESLNDIERHIDKDQAGRSGDG